MEVAVESNAIDTLTLANQAENNFVESRFLFFCVEVILDGLGELMAVTGTNVSDTGSDFRQKLSGQIEEHWRNTALNILVLSLL